MCRNLSYCPFLSVHFPDILCNVFSCAATFHTSFVCIDYEIYIKYCENLDISTELIDLQLNAFLFSHELFTSRSTKGRIRAFVM